MRVYDYLCNAGHRTEHFVAGDDIDYRTCPECGGQAQRLKCTPRFALEGTTGAFPTAYDQWEKKRLQKQRIEERRERDHGDDGWR